MRDLIREWLCWDSDPADGGQLSPASQGPGVQADMEKVTVYQVPLIPPRTEPGDSLRTRFLTPEVIPSTCCLLQGSPITVTEHRNTWKLHLPDMPGSRALLKLFSVSFSSFKGPRILSMLQFPLRERAHASPLYSGEIQVSSLPKSFELRALLIVRRSIWFLIWNLGDICLDSWRYEGEGRLSSSLKPHHLPGECLRQGPKSKKRAKWQSSPLENWFHPIRGQFIFKPSLWRITFQAPHPGFCPPSWNASHPQERHCHWLESDYGLIQSPVTPSDGLPIYNYFNYTCKDKDQEQMSDIWIKINDHLLMEWRVIHHFISTDS